MRARERRTCFFQQHQASNCQYMGFLVWDQVCTILSKLDHQGQVVDREVTEHTPRRTGAQFHAIRWLALWHIQAMQDLSHVTKNPRPASGRGIAGPVRNNLTRAAKPDA